MIFLVIIATIEMKVHFCMKLFDHFPTEYWSVGVEIFQVSSQILLGFFHKISSRNSFWKIFETLLALQGAALSRFAKFHMSFSNFILSLYFAEKFRKHTSNFICRMYLVKEARPKRKHRKINKKEKPGRSVFGKTSFLILFALGQGLITPSSFGVRFEIFTRHSLLCCG